MNFQLVETYIYWWPVTVRIPNPEPGKAGTLIEQTFQMQFEPQSRDQIIATQKELAALTDIDEIAAREHEILRDACKDWSGVVTDGKPVPFNAETFRAAMQKTWFRIGVYEAFNDSQSGEEARLGNSGQPDVPGRLDG